ncbi:uncharacterized protein LOC131213913 [Anopheles bellator]|uniref:uncharacterized protein LOC131213913 n=1 Tax=Anopheles bellator TaxID=139047 RepID=UPI002648F34F|nr:uncharacterized protein LOC131213913 [Anopheles bellator]XP_058064124.1 uncharacterized protein LOC131213913 [Anopheles bellator]
MAVFLTNICKFNQCGRIFNSLTDLIHHIENTHIDHESPAPGFSEKSQSTCLPLSYVLRYHNDNSCKDTASSSASTTTPATATDKNKQVGNVTTGGVGLSSTLPSATIACPASPVDLGASNGGSAVGGVSHTPTIGGSNGPTLAVDGIAKPSVSIGSQNSGDLKRKIAIKHHSYSISSSNRSTTPTGSEMDDDDMMGSESEDSDDSYTTEEFSSEFIMRYGSRRHSSSGANGSTVSNEKPFACPVPGCKKRYKNVNGIKYHSKNGHKKDGNRVRKGFKCFCGKSYKTSLRLKNHNIIAHAQVASNDGTDVQQPTGSAQISSVSATNGGSLSTTSTTVTANTLTSTVLKPSSPISNHGNAVKISSQIGTNASPAAVTITQLAHKLPRTTTNATSTITSSTASAASIVTTTVSAVNTPEITTITTIASGPPSTSTIHTVATGSSIKYDNLGILTPATSPKLTANISSDAQQQQPFIPVTVSVAHSSPTLLGNFNATNAPLTGNGQLVTAASGSYGLGGNGTAFYSGVGGDGGGGNSGVGIALVVSNVVGESLNGSGGSGGTAVLSVSTAASQLYAEET